MQTEVLRHEDPKPEEAGWEMNYMHNNPVKRSRVKHPGDWPWSRCGRRFYFWNEGSILVMDEML